MKNSLDSTSLTWFITGTSQGFGHELVRAALQRGDRVVATSRNPQKVMDSFPHEKERLLAVTLDFGNPDNIITAVQTAIDRFGRIDVLVNNAGYGLLGAVEEASDPEIAKVYEINVFGLMRVTRTILPYMRNQHSGHIVNLSSIGGLVGLAGWGIYNSTKFAIEGYSEALAEEVSPLGIKVTIVEPGPFRTDFLGEALRTTQKVISDYEQTAGRTRALAKERKGKQQGDPVRAADVIVQAVLSENPPLHLILGSIAYERANKKINDLHNEFSAWRELALSVDFSP